MQKSVTYMIEDENDWKFLNEKIWFLIFNFDQDIDMLKRSSKRIHISNIPFAFRENDLKFHFQCFGKITNVQVIYNERGSKGFGFLTYEKSSSARLALQMMHGKIICGRKIQVNSAIIKRIHYNKENDSFESTGCKSNCRLN